jgi:ribosomal protein S18 acetylase RimI-like enzyme
MDDGRLHLRAETAADAPFLTALYRSTRDDLTALGDDPVIDDLIKMQQKIHESGQHAQFPHARFLLLHRDEEGIARIVLDQDAQRWHLVDIAVLPAMHRQGIAGWLLRWMQSGAAQENLPLTLNVQKHNLPARTLYLKHGFVISGTDTMFEQMRWQANGMNKENT